MACRTKKLIVPRCAVALAVPWSIEDRIFDAKYHCVLRLRTVSTAELSIVEQSIVFFGARIPVGDCALF